MQILKQVSQFKFIWLRALCDLIVDKMLLASYLTIF